MKLPLKHIIVLVIISLTAIFAYQVYWLVNMYHSNVAQTQVAIQNAIRNADHIELFLRTDSLSKSRGKNQTIRAHGNSSGSVSFSTSFIPSGQHDSSSKVQAIFEQVLKDSIDRKEAEVHEYKGLPGNVSVGDDFSTLELMAVQLQKGLHRVIDLKVEPINLNRFDSILHQNLIKSQLDIKHYTRIVKLDNDSTLSSSLTAEVDTTSLERYEYFYDIYDQYAFRVYTEPTSHIVMKQMVGILSTSFFILIILGASFGFLIHTIMRQKTLDEMKSDFTNNITHELKTPIAVAYAANDALLNFNRADNKVQRDRYLRISQEQLQKLSGLVEQILSMSMEHRNTFKFNIEEVQIDALIHSLAELHKLKADKPVTITVEVVPTQMSIFTDRTHFNNIISNLIENAIKYSPQNANIDISCKIEDNQCVISVADHGLGISSEKQQHIFDKFYRIPTGNLHNVKGYGLGLYYVKTMIEKLGGRIDVRSELGKGSTFTIHIPLSI